MNVACGSMRRDASAFLDRRVAPIRHALILAHLEDCADCLENVRSLKAVIGRATAIPHEPGDDELALRVKRTLAAGWAREHWERSRVKRNVGPRRALVAAAGALLVLGIYCAGFRHGAWTPRGPIERDGFERGAFSLLEDVAALEEVPVELREPVVRAQVRSLGLDSAAATWLAGEERDRRLDALASFIVSLESSPVAPWSEAARGLLVQLEPSRSVEPPGRLRFVGEVSESSAPALAEPYQRSLQNLIDLKRVWIERGAGAVVPLIERERVRATDPLAPMFERLWREVQGG